MKLREIAVSVRSSAGLTFILAVVFGVITIALETSFALPVRAPGHRAFVGAVALLAFAEAFNPVLLLAFAGAVSATLVIGGGAPPLAIAVWVLSAAGITLLTRSPLAKTVLVFVIGGLLYGLLRYLSQMAGFHHTPEIMRVAGHLGFGLAGGLAAFGGARAITRLNR